MLKISLVQLNPLVADLEGNAIRISEEIIKARVAGSDLIVFPELALCGYPPRDFLYFSQFIIRCEQLLHEIAKVCTNIYAIVGAPVNNPGSSGKRLFNAAVCMHEGKIQQIIYKSLLPDYDVFDEYRYFEPGRNPNCLEINGVKMAVTICEDIWNIGDKSNLYEYNPMDILATENPCLLINIAASPFSYKHPKIRNRILTLNSQKYNIPIIYVNQCGGHTELIFDGNSQLINTNGVAHTLRSFREQTIQVVFENGQISAPNNILDHYKDNSEFELSELVERALINGVRDYFKKSGFSKAILGLSGGIDSALVSVIAVRALGAENVIPVLLPSEWSSKHSISDSIELIKNLNIENYHQIYIQDIFKQIQFSLSPFFQDKPIDITEENIQSRIRGLLLMGLSNKHGYILLNTSNKSELAVGYGTLYGDMCGGLSVIGDLYKTEVYQLCKYINRNSDIIPENILTKPPSAELRPDQKDTDSLPEYDLLDKILFQYIENNKMQQEIIELGLPAEIVKKVIRLVNMSEYKRYQTPPILRISPRAFGPGRRMPIVARY